MASQAVNYHNESGEYAPRLTDWVKEPRLCDLITDLEGAKQVQGTQIAKITRWNDLLHVRGSAKPKKVKGRSAVQPKLIRRQAEWRYSALTEPFLSSDKLWKVKPVTFEDGDGARQNELVLNWQFRTKLNRVKFIDDLVRSTADEGTSIIKTGWIRRTVKVKEEVPVYSYFEIQDKAQLQQLQEAIGLKLSDPRGYNENVDPLIKAAIDYYEETGTAVYAKDTGEVEVVETEKVLENRPTAEVLNPANVFIDPTCNGDFDKAMFVVYSFETCLADLKKEGDRYKNLDKVDFDGSTPLQQPDHETQIPDPINLHDRARKKFVAYEYWGYYAINGDDEPLVPIVATWIGHTLIRLEISPFPDEKLPFIVIPYLPVKRELYGETDAELLEDNQAIHGAITRGLIDLMGRSANSQQGFAKGMLDPLNRRRFENGQDYEFNPNLTPANGLIQHKYPEIPQSAMLMLNIQNQEAEALTGVKSFAGGMSGEAYGDVAAGIRGVLDAASKREMAILRRLATGIIQLGQKFASMNAVFLSEEETIRVTNDEFKTVLREDLIGNFDLDVDISTAEVDAQQAQDLAFMLQTLGNTVDIGITLMILSEIARLKKMPELAERIAKFQPQPDPLAQELQKLQIEELRLKIAKMKSEVALNEAKVDKTEAETDNLNLEFVEQETGTNHAREMEKTQAQSQGNQDLEVTKALLAKKKEGEKDGDIDAAIGFGQISRQRDTNSSAPSAVPASPIPAPAPVPVLPEIGPEIGGAGLPIDPAVDPSLEPTV